MERSIRLDVVFLTRLIRPPAVTVTPVSASSSVLMLLKNEAAFLPCSAISLAVFFASSRCFLRSSLTSFCPLRKSDVSRPSVIRRASITVAAMITLRYGSVGVIHGHYFNQPPHILNAVYRVQFVEFCLTPGDYCGDSTRYIHVLYKAAI